MALNYLLSPEFQIVNSAGRPASGGYLEVYYHGTRDRYYCASDFNGTLHPFQVPLDSLGGNVVLADDSHAYDVYIYNRYGSLLMSRYNVHPSSGGSMGGVLTSSDGSVTITPTQDGYDLSVDDGKAATFRAAADSLSADGYFSFRKIEGEGDAIYLDNGSIKMDDGWYHFSATVKLTWYGQPVNDTSTVRLYSGATYDVIDFDYSYNHSDTVVLDGDLWIGAYSTHYISFGRNFSLGVTGMRQGMVAELVDCDLHSIIGQGVGGNGEKNIHRLLRYFTNSEEADEQHPVGDWLHDLDAVDPDDPSGHPMVTADQLFAWYDAGQIFDLYEAGADGITDWSAVYHMSTWQDQSDWWSQYAPVPGKACRLEFYRMGGYASINRGMMIAYIRYKEEDYMRLYQIMPGQDVWTMDFQPELTAGSNISISGSTISATDTTYTAGTGLSLTGTEFSADTSVLATQSDLAGKQDVLTAGQNITIDSSNVISATDTTYTAGTGIDITNDEISVDTSVVATQSDLSSKQDTLTAGSNIQINGATISATDTTYTAGTGLSLNGTEFSADTTVLATQTDLSSKQDTLTAGTNITIQNNTISATDTTYTAGTGIDITGDVISADTSVLATQSDLSGKQDTLTAGSNITIQNNVISASAAPQVQANWTESDSSAVSYIQNKPDLSIYAESANLATVATTGDYDDLIDKPDLSIYAETSNLATVATTGDYDDLINKPTIPAAQVNSDWNSSSGVSQILNKPDLSVYATQTDLASKQDTLTAGSNITISNNTISATDTTYSAGTGIDITGTTISADTSVLATQQDLSGKQDTLTAGTNVQINNNVISATDTTYSAGSNIQINGTTISATDTTYTAGTGLSLNGTEFSADTTVLATQSDLSNKQDTLTAGSNISISNNTISATDTTYSAGTGLSLTGTTFAADTTVLATKSDLNGKQDTLTFSNPLKNVSNTVSLDYDTDTLSTSTTTESTVATFSGAYEGGVYIPILSYGDQGDVGESLDEGTPYSSITVHIPGNTFEFNWFDTSSRAVGLELGVERTFNNGREAVRYLTPVSVTEDQNTGYMVVDEQDVVLTLPSLQSTDWTAQGFYFISSATLYLVLARYDIGSDSVSNQFARLVDNTVQPVVTMSTSVTTDVPLTVKDPLPAHTSSDSGKVLGIDANGDTEWTTVSGAGGADWDATSGEPGYIENKPTPKVLTAGTNISIAETANALTISATAAPQVNADWTSSSGVSEILHKPTEKTLAAGSNITITEANDVVTVAATDTTYTAGTGISISSNVISADETVLYDVGSGTLTGSVVLSEAPSNFERLGITYKTWNDNAGDQYVEVPANQSFFTFGSDYVPTSGAVAHFYTRLSLSTLTLACARHCYVNSGAPSTVSDGTSTFKFYKVVGINRIASN